MSFAILMAGCRSTKQTYIIHSNGPYKDHLLYMLLSSNRWKPQEALETLGVFNV